MAITPGQARTKGATSGATKSELKRHIKEIDRMLVEGDRTYACSLIGSGMVEDHIIQEYRSAGWEVQRISDFRDGDFLQFKEPRQ